MGPHGFASLEYSMDGLQHHRQEFGSQHLSKFASSRLIITFIFAESHHCFLVLQLPLLASRTLIGRNGTPSQPRPQAAPKHNTTRSSTSSQ